MTYSWPPLMEGGHSRGRRHMTEWVGEWEARREERKRKRK